MPASASNMLALPLWGAKLTAFADSTLVFIGERDHSGRSGWHLASRVPLRAGIFD